MFRKSILLLTALSMMGCSGPTPKAPESAAEVSEIVTLKEEKTPVMDSKIMTWPDLTSRPLPKPTATIKYSDLPTGVVDVWVPDGEGPHPVVLMIHGGCWQKAIADRTLRNYAAEALRQEGLAVWNVEYRGVDEPGGGYPGTYEDVARAGNAMAEHASEFDLDIGWIAGFGHSAGGHLITWYAGSINLPDNSEIKVRRDIDLKGIINSGGLADLVESEPVTLASCLAEIRPRLIGKATKNRPDPYADTSSDRLLPTGVETHVVNGGLDKIAPENLGFAYYAKAGKAGDRGKISISRKEGHVELIAPGTIVFERQIEILQELLALK